MKPSNTNTQAIEREIEQGATIRPEDAPDVGAETAEQAADLARLQGMVGGAEQPAALPAVQAEPEGPTLQEEIAGAMGMAVAVLSPMFKSLREIYTPDAIGASSGAIAALCMKHGWLQGGLMGKYGEEIACVAVVGPLAYATYKGVQADLADMAKEKPVEAVVKGEGIDLAAPVPAATAPARGGPAVTFGSAPA